MQNINHIFLFDLCAYLYFSSIRHTVRCFACFCNPYSMFIILPISRHLINIYNHKHLLHEHHMSKHVGPDHHMMTVHMRTVARAFLQISIGPAQQLHPRSCNPIKSCTTAGITMCLCAYRQCFACHLCQWLWLCPRRTLDGTMPISTQAVYTIGGSGL
jgi:hypothetical protein